MHMFFSHLVSNKAYMYTLQKYLAAWQLFGITVELDNKKLFYISDPPFYMGPQQKEFYGNAKCHQHFSLQDYHSLQTLFKGGFIRPPLI